MNDLDDAELFDRLSPLSAVVPQPGRAAEVLRSARRVAMRRRYVRWGITSALAATVALAVVGLAWNLAARPASAADGLARAAQATRQYKGWIHLRTDMDALGESIVQHIDNRSGVSATVTHHDGKLVVRMYLLAELEQIDFDGREIRIGPIDKAFAEHMKANVQGTPLTLDDTLRLIPGLTVQQSRDGPLTRFDLIFPHDDPATAAAQHRTVYPKSAAAWVDPQDGLMRRADMEIDGKTVTSVITYGDPPIKDVYDVGVPRDARVVDVRPARDARDLEDRVQRRFDAGFGNAVAVVTTTTRYTGHGKAYEPESEIEVFGTAGADTVADTFRVDAADAVRRATALRSDLTGWPTPSIDVALHALEGKVPSNFLVCRSDHTWQGHSSRAGEIESADLGGRDVPEAKHARELAALPATFWPARDMRLFGTDGTARLITDPAHPGLTGHQLDRLYFMRAPDDTRLSQTYWFDPAKDDLAVELSDTYTSVATGRVVEQSHRAFSDFNRTGDGHWYPTRCASTRMMANPGGTSRMEWSIEQHVQVETGRTLAARWYADPDNH